MTKTGPTVLSTSQPERDDTTCYLERSKVREILIGHNAATQAVLSKIDALPIFVAEDFRAQCAPKPTAWRWRPRGSTNWIYDPTDEWRLDNQDNIEFEPLYAALAATPAEPEDEPGYGGRYGLQRRHPGAGTPAVRGEAPPVATNFYGEKAVLIYRAAGLVLAASEIDMQGRTCGSVRAGRILTKISDRLRDDGVALRKQADAIAAPPASPLRGRETFDAWFNSHFLDPDGGSTNLPDWLKDDLRSAWDAASASPPKQPASPVQKATALAADRLASLTAPQQPAADPGTGRVELIEQCAKIADPWSGFIDADKMGAADNAVIKVRNDIAAAIRSLKETQA